MDERRAPHDDADGGGVPSDAELRRVVGGDPGLRAERSSFVAPPLVAVAAGLLPSADLAGLALAIGAVALGYRFPGRPARTALLMGLPAAVVLGVRAAFGGLDELFGATDVTALSVVYLVTGALFGLLFLAMLAALGTIVATGRAEQRARGPQPWDRPRIVATATMAVAALLFFGVPLAFALFG